MITGNVTGIKATLLTRLEALFDLKTDVYTFANEQIVEEIIDITGLLNREVSVALDRRGNVVEISVGDSSTVKLPKIQTYKKGLSGIRIIHTHPNGNSQLSDVDISALLSLKLDAMIAVGVREEQNSTVTFGFCCEVDGVRMYQMTEEYTMEEAFAFDILEYIEECEKSLSHNSQEVDGDKDVALVVGTDTKDSLAELIELAHACEISVEGSLFQRRSSIDKKYFIGSGKVDELSLERQVVNANIVIFDDELSGVQLRNLEAKLGCRVIDRTMLILEIFARRAKTKEAKIQVLIAKLKYQRSRLLGQGVEMSRLGGGIGSKGSGETKLELDRRKIREMIHHYQSELKKVESTQVLQKNKRQKSNIRQVALVGYTNVGKSTLRNLVIDIYGDTTGAAKEHVHAQDMLFATLGTTVRTFSLPDKRVASLVDTVGFIRKLPHDLVESFKSTLSEVIDADLIVHVVDSSSEQVFDQIDAVNKVLEELDCLRTRQLIVLNKCDVATEKQLDKLAASDFQESVRISAKTNDGIDQLLQKIAEMLPNPMIERTIRIPYDQSDKLSMVYRDCNVIDVTYDEKGTIFHIMMPLSKEAEYQMYIC